MSSSMHLGMDDQQLVNVSDTAALVSSISSDISNSGSSSSSNNRNNSGTSSSSREAEVSSSTNIPYSHLEDGHSPPSTPPPPPALTLAPLPLESLASKPLPSTLPQSSPTGQFQQSSGLSTQQKIRKARSLSTTSSSSVSSTSPIQITPKLSTDTSTNATIQTITVPVACKQEEEIDVGIPVEGRSFKNLLGKPILNANPFPRGTALLTPTISVSDTSGIVGCEYQYSVDDVSGNSQTSVSFLENSSASFGPESLNFESSAAPLSVEIQTLTPGGPHNQGSSGEDSKIIPAVSLGGPHIHESSGEATKIIPAVSSGGQSDSPLSMELQADAISSSYDHTVLSIEDDTQGPMILAKKSITFKLSGQTRVRHLNTPNTAGSSNYLDIPDDTHSTTSSIRLSTQWVTISEILEKDNVAELRGEILRNSRISNSMMRPSGAPNSQTILHGSVDLNAIKCFQFIVESFHDTSNLDIPDQEGNSALHIAVRLQRVGMIKTLIEAGAFVNCRNCLGDTPLHIIVKNFRSTKDETSHVLINDCLNELLKSSNIDLNPVNKINQTPLLVALPWLESDVPWAQEFCKQLIEEGVEVSSEICEIITDSVQGVGEQGTKFHERESTSVLLDFILHNNEHGFLKELGRDNNSISLLQHKWLENKPILHHIVEKFEPGVLKMFLLDGIDSWALDVFGEMALHVALRRGRLDIVSLLLTHMKSHNDSIDLREHSYTLLRGALVQIPAIINKEPGSNHLQCIRKLFEESILDVNQRDSCRRVTALDVASENRLQAVMDLLQQHGASSAATGRAASLPSTEYIDPILNEDNVARLMSEIERSGHVLSDKHLNPRPVLQKAIEYPAFECLRFLVSNVTRPQNLDEPNRDGRTALHHAVVYDLPHVVELLLQSGAHVNSRDNDGNSALHLLANKCLECCVLESETLLNIGLIILKHPDVDVNAVNKKKQTPFSIASNWYSSIPNCAASFCQLLLHFNVESSDDETRRIHNSAPIFFSPTIVTSIPKKTWLSQGADYVILKDKVNLELTLDYFLATEDFSVENLKFAELPFLGSKRILQIAVKQFDISIVKKMLDLGANPWRTSHDGTLPLHEALQRGHFGMVDLLITRMKSNGSVDLRLHSFSLLQKALAHSTGFATVSHQTQPSSTLSPDSGLNEDSCKGLEAYNKCLARLLEEDVIIDVHATRNKTTPMAIAYALDNKEAVDLLKRCDAEEITFFNEEEQGLQSEWTWREIKKLLEKDQASVFEVELLKQRKNTIESVLRFQNDSNQSTTLLHEAIDAKAVYCFNILLQYISNPRTLDLPNGLGETPLHSAVMKSGGLSYVEKLLEAGAFVNSRDDQGNTPLISLVKTSVEAFSDSQPFNPSVFDCVQLLLKHPLVDPYARNAYGKTALDVASDKLIVRHESANLLCDMLRSQKRGSSPTDKTSKKLHWLNKLFDGITNGDMKTKQIIAELRRCELDDINDYYLGSQNILSPAIKKTDHTIVRQLIEIGVDPNKRNVNGTLPLHTAVEEASLEIVDFLLETMKGKSKCVPLKQDSFTLLHTAIKGIESVRSHQDEGKYVRCIERLLGKDVEIDVNQKEIKHDTEGVTALNIAATINNQNVMKLLLQNGAYLLGEQEDSKDEKMHILSSLDVDTFLAAMDNCISMPDSCDQKKDEIYLDLDYRFLIPPERNEHGKNKNQSAIEIINKTEKSCLRCCSSRKVSEEEETRSLANTVLQVGMNRTHMNFVKHPIMLTLLETKWGAIKLSFLFNLTLSVLFHVVFLVFLFLKNIDILLWEIKHINGTDVSYSVDKSQWFYVWFILSDILLVPLILYFVLREMLLLITTKKKYFMDFENYLEISVFILAFLLSFIKLEVETLKHITAWGLVLGCCDFLLILGNIPAFAVPITMFRFVSVKIFKYFLFFLFPIGAFTISFFFLVMPPTNSNINVEQTISSFITDMFGMAAGGLDFYKNVERESTSFWTTISLLFLFLMFFFLVFLVQMNLMTGIAVADVKEFSEDVDYHNIINRWKKVEQFEIWLPVWQMLEKRVTNESIRAFIKPRLRRLQHPSRSNYSIRVEIERGRNKKLTISNSSQVRSAKKRKRGVSVQSRFFRQNTVDAYITASLREIHLRNMKNKDAPSKLYSEVELIVDGHLAKLTSSREEIARDAGDVRSVVDEGNKEREQTGGMRGKRILGKIKESAERQRQQDILHALNVIMDTLKEQHARLDRMEQARLDWSERQETSTSN